MAGRLLAVTGGHRFDEPAFTAMLDHVCERLGWAWAHARQPSAQDWLRPQHAGTWDAILLHDLPGLSLARGAEPILHEPPAAVRDGVLGLLDAGQGIVATHHALAGWPAWDEWADVLGGRFLYAPGRLHGVDVPASGYRMDTYRVEPASPGHPVCAGVEPFEITDELYRCPVFAGSVTPLLSTRADTSSATMIDTHSEVRSGEQIPATEQPGSSLLGWAKQARSSRLVYIQPGHTAGTMRHEMYRRLLANAVGWVAG
jgi:type 1 glutamine amidotransferase